MSNELSAEIKATIIPQKQAFETWPKVRKIDMGRGPRSRNLNENPSS